jgi:hypothetical protein
VDRIELVLKFDTVSMRIEGTESSSIRYIRCDTYRMYRGDPDPRSRSLAKRADASRRTYHCEWDRG